MAGTEVGGRSRALAEGKTKIIVARDDGSDWVDVISKDDITAGDGAKHDVIAGKAEFATRTTCNVFRLLRDCGIPVAFIEQTDGRTFVAPRCRMFPYEVVVRREAHGSYLKRSPHIPKGHIFQQLVVEFFLKTSGKKWEDRDLVCDDPFMVCRENKAICLYDPKLPNLANMPAEPFLVLRDGDVFTQDNEKELLGKMTDIARRAFLVLEKAWQIEGERLVDFKVEFGLTASGELVLADVIDNDSWRVLDEGVHLDKQAYRDGGKLEDVAEKYRRVAEITDRFRLPKQQVVIWRGSEKDSVAFLESAICRPFADNFSKAASTGCLKSRVVTCSMHKKPSCGLHLLGKLVQETPDTVFIVLVGKSNGAGPTLSAHTHVPVITIPATYKEFPDDVWSSLRMPSDVPVMTVLEPANAVLAALQILAMRNPFLYMFLRAELEDRMVNVLML